MSVDLQRIVLLNRLVSRSVSQAPEDIDAPTHGLRELLGLIEQRRRAGEEVEYLGAEDSDDEQDRRARGAGHNFIRLRAFKLVKNADGSEDAAMLLEHLNENDRAFPVVNRKTLGGREIAGEPEERGAASAHMVVRIPRADAADHGSYRCVIESQSPISRSMIESYLCKQLRRHVKAAGGWTFEVAESERGKKAKKKVYKYHPRLELFADFGRQQKVTGDRVLSHMVFTKRAEKQNLGRGADVVHQDVVADVKLRISAKQGPDEKGKLATWATGIRAWYENRGYKAKLYFRHPDGALLGGDMHEAVAHAADLFMCSREPISLSSAPKRWRETIHAETVEKMQELLSKDALWERAK